MQSLVYSRGDDRLRLTGGGREQPEPNDLRAHGPVGGRECGYPGAATAAATHPPAPTAASLVRQPPRRRRTLIRRSLVVADSAGLSAAFLASTLIFGLSAEGAGARPTYELVVFFLSLPVWVLLAAMHGLYRYDDERLGYSTVDDFVGVIHLVTLGAWIFFLGCWLTGISYPRAGKLIVFWMLATLLVSGCRVLARSICLRSPAYLQNVIVIGAGEMGQLVARKVSQHREYGLRLLGLIDEDPLPLRRDLGDVAVLGPLDELPRLVRDLEVERVIVAFSSESDAHTATVLRTLHDLDVQVDVVPRLYELLGPRVDLHSLEGLPLVGLPAPRRSAVALSVKRLMDIIGALVGLALLSPAFVLIAWRIRRGLRRPGLLSPDEAWAEHARVHRTQVPDDVGGRGRQRPPGLHLRDDERRRRDR